MDALRRIPAAVRWISAEPLLEDISQDINLDGFAWVVTGGESGIGPEYTWDPTADWKAELKREDGRRTMKYRWAANLRDKVKAAGLPFMFKQVTAPKSGFGYNALDGVDWHEFPPAPNGLDWALRQPIPDKYKMNDFQLKTFAKGETYPFRINDEDRLLRNALVSVRETQCKSERLVHDADFRATVAMGQALYRLKVNLPKSEHPFDETTHKYEYDFYPDSIEVALSEKAFAEWKRLLKEKHISEEDAERFVAAYWNALATKRNQKSIREITGRSGRFKPPPLGNTTFGKIANLLRKAYDVKTLEGLSQCAMDFAAALKVLKESSTCPNGVKIRADHKPRRNCRTDKDKMMTGIIFLLGAGGCLPTHLFLRDLGIRFFVATTDAAMESAGVRQRHPSLSCR
jgi:hypothetical protein